MKIFDYSSDQKKLNTRMNFLRGVFAILIVLGHCSINYEKEVPLLLLIHKSNFVSVCFFFFISGWSLAFNYIKKQDYLKTFVYRKIARLVILAVVCKLIEKALKYFILRESFTVDIDLLLGWNWYIYQTLGLYSIFFIVYLNRLKLSFKPVLVFAVVFILVTGLWIVKTVFIIDVPMNYFWSVLSFPVGCLIGGFYDGIDRFYKTHKPICYIVSFALVLVNSLCLVFRGNYFSEFIMHNILGICGMLLLFLVIRYVNVTLIRFLSPLTMISGEIYFYQFVVLYITRELFAKAGLRINVLYCLVVVATTVILAAIIHIIVNTPRRIIKLTKQAG